MIYLVNWILFIKNSHYLIFFHIILVIITPDQGITIRLKKDPAFTELKLDPNDYGGISTIRNDILKYYQYMQFKRAHFDCKKLTFTDKGRVQSFRFEFTGKFE